MVNEAAVVAARQRGRRDGEGGTPVVMLCMPLVSSTPPLDAKPTLSLLLTYRGVAHLPADLLESPSGDSGCHSRGRGRNTQEFPQRFADRSGPLAPRQAPRTSSVSKNEHSRSKVPPRSPSPLLRSPQPTSGTIALTYSTSSAEHQPRFSAARRPCGSSANGPYPRTKLPKIQPRASRAWLRSPELPDGSRRKTWTGCSGLVSEQGTSATWRSWPRYATRASG
jgi:hypothetical protein